MLTRLSVYTTILGLFALFSACSNNEPPVINTSKDISDIAEPFLNALQKGNRGEAEKYVSTAAQDELAAQFAQDHKRLAAAPKLTARYILPPSEFPGTENDGQETNIVYAVRKGNVWTTANIRLYRYRDEPYVIEYWRINNEIPQAVFQNSASEKQMKDMQKAQPVMYGMFGIMGLFCIIGIVAIIWFVRNKAHLIAPDAQEQPRAAAITRREEGTEP
jgi:hypothetical protein